MKPFLMRIAPLFVALFLPLVDSKSASYSVLHSFGSLTNVQGFNPQAPLVQGADGALYGTTSSGEGAVGGVVFKIQPDGTGFTALKLFTNSLDGLKPRGGLAISGTTLFGATQLGGAAGGGTIFKINTDGTGFATLHSFGPLNPDPVLSNINTNSDGAEPKGGLVLSANVLFGTAYYGGTNGGGTVFRINTDGTEFSTLRHFRGNFPSFDGANPGGRLVVSGNTVYGTTEFGGGSGLIIEGWGTLFKINTDGSGFAKLHDFDNQSAHPAGLALSGGTLFGASGGTVNGSRGVTVFKIGINGTGFAVLTRMGSLDEISGDLIVSGNILYGTTRASGAGMGTVFRLGTNGAGLTTLYDFQNFPPTNGASPVAGMLLVGGTLYGTTEFGGNSGEGTVFKINTNGTGFTVLQSFAHSGSRRPASGLVLSGATLFGTTELGAEATGGSVFKVETDGTGYATLKDFTGTPLSGPSGQLLLSGGDLYGTVGGNSGAVFKVGTNGTGYTALKMFPPTEVDFMTGLATNADGALPMGELVMSGATLYGTTSRGGGAGNGTVFKVNIDGTGFLVLKTFSGGAFDPTFALTNAGGMSPQAGLLLSGTTLYGTAYYGGSAGKGTVFKLNTDGAGFATLINFNGANGQRPSGSLVLTGEVLYGTTEGGGNSDLGTIFKIRTDGSGFVRLHSFSGADGISPAARLELLGNALYGAAWFGGMTNNSGPSGLGTLFRINLDGTGFTNLHKFNGTEGSNPKSSLVANGRMLYGAATAGGHMGNGVVFALNLSPAPIPLNFQLAGDRLLLNWSNPAFGLQAAPDPGGVYTNIIGATSPYTNSLDGSRFFRLLAE